MERVKKYRCWKYDGSSEVVSNEDGNLWLLHDCKHFDDWTGLTDNAGRDVFEGDIVLGDAVVVFRSKPDANREYSCFGITSGKYTLADYHFRDDFVVTGNIYENPDLLQNPETK